MPTQVLAQRLGDEVLYLSLLCDADEAHAPVESSRDSHTESDERLLIGSALSFTERTGEVDAHGLLQGGTRSLFEVGKMLEDEYRAVAQRSPQNAQRVLDKLKAHALLARSVKQLEEGRTVREEVGEYVRGNVSADELLKRLLRYEVQVPQDLQPRPVY